MSTTSSALQGAAGVVLIAVGIVINVYTGGTAGTPLIMLGASVGPQASRQSLMPRGLGA